MKEERIIRALNEVEDRRVHKRPNGIIFLDFQRF